MSVRKLDRYVRDLRRDVKSIEIPQDLADRFTRYRDDPAGFARDVLQLELPPYQDAVLTDVAAHERVAWVAGHAVGKTVAAAVLVIWYLLTRPGCRCVITSATFERQVGRVIFAKIRSLAAGAREALPLDVYSTRCEVAGHDEWSCEGVPSTKPENFAGFHAPRMLVIGDEAKSVPSPVFTELQGVLASAREEARLVLLSTAGPAEGYFYNAFLRNADLWRLHRTPSTESPFATGFSERMLQDCLGPEDPIYRMRVMAEFAEDVEGQLIPLSAIHAAIDRELEVVEGVEPALVLGLDVARFGDDRTVLATALGGAVQGLTPWRGADTMATAERVASVINARHPARVLVDEIGIGSGVVDRLVQLGHAVEPVNVGGGASDPSLFLNLRAEIGWRIRERFERGDVSIPDDAGLVSELASMRYGYDARGRIKLEPKSEAKSRLGRSPDLADAVMLALWGSTTGPVVEPYEEWFGPYEPGELARELGVGDDWTPFVL